MRSYRQYCGLARALDVVGDRWTLLIVRELMIRGSARYSDLLAGLPGIATNLLADRLREMEESGLVMREELPPPVTATLFKLTERGLELEDALAALGKWASPLMGKPRRDDQVRAHWAVLPVKFFLKDRSPNLAPISIQLELNGEPVLLRTNGSGGVVASPGESASADATVAGEQPIVMGLLAGRMTLEQARAKGLRFSGSRAALDRVRRVKPVSIRKG